MNTQSISVIIITAIGACSIAACGSSATEGGGDNSSAAATSADGNPPVATGAHADPCLTQLAKLQITHDLDLSQIDADWRKNGGGNGKPATNVPALKASVTNKSSGVYVWDLVTPNVTTDPETGDVSIPAIVKPVSLHLKYTVQARSSPQACTLVSVTPVSCPAIAIDAAIKESKKNGFHGNGPDQPMIGTGIEISEWTLNGPKGYWFSIQNPTNFREPFPGNVTVPVEYAVITTSLDDGCAVAMEPKYADGVTGE
jgi:hypothetical protein